MDRIVFVVLLLSVLVPACLAVWCPVPWKQLPVHTLEITTSEFHEACHSNAFNEDPCLTRLRANLAQMILDYKQLVHEWGIYVDYSYPDGAERALGPATRLFNRLARLDPESTCEFDCVATRRFNLTAAVEQTLPRELRGHVNWTQQPRGSRYCWRNETEGGSSTMDLHRLTVSIKISGRDRDLIDCVSGYTCKYYW